MVRDALIIKKERDWLSDEVTHFVEDQMDSRMRFTASSGKIQVELAKMAIMLGLAPTTTATDPLVVAGDGNFFNIHRKLSQVMGDWKHWDDVARAQFSKREWGTPNPYA